MNMYEQEVESCQLPVVGFPFIDGHMPCVTNSAATMVQEAHNGQIAEYRVCD